MRFHKWAYYGKDDEGRVRWRCDDCSTRKLTSDPEGNHIVGFVAVSPTCAERRGILFRKAEGFKDLETREELNELVGVIEDDMTRVLVKLIYLIAGRIGEIIKVRKKDFRFIQKDLMIYRTILKRKDTPYEATWVPLEDSFLKEILDHIKTIEPKHYIFPHRDVVFGWAYNIEPTQHVSSRHARRLVGQATGKHPHYFRHLRLSHLAPYMTSPFQLQAFSHHAKVDSLSKYVHLMPSVYKDRVPVG